MRIVCRNQPRLSPAGFKVDHIDFRESLLARFADDYPRIMYSGKTLFATLMNCRPDGVVHSVSRIADVHAGVEFGSATLFASANTRKFVPYRTW